MLIVVVYDIILVTIDMCIGVFNIEDNFQRFFCFIKTFYNTIKQINHRPFFRINRSCNQFLLE